MGVLVSILRIKKRFLSQCFKLASYPCKIKLNWTVFNFHSRDENAGKKTYAAVDAVFLFIAAFQDSEIGCGDRPTFSPVYTVYWDIFNGQQYTKSD